MQNAGEGDDEGEEQGEGGEDKSLEDEGA